MRYADLTTGKVYPGPEFRPRVFRSFDGHIMARIVEAELDEGSVWIQKNGRRCRMSAYGVGAYGNLRVIALYPYAGGPGEMSVSWGPMTFLANHACIATPNDAAQVLADIRQLEKLWAEPVETPAAQKRARVCTCTLADSRRRALPHPHYARSVRDYDADKWMAHNIDCPARDIPDEPTHADDPCSVCGVPVAILDQCTDGDRMLCKRCWHALGEPETEPEEPTHYEDPYISRRAKRWRKNIESGDSDAIVEVTLTNSTSEEPLVLKPYAGQAQRIAAILDDGFRLPWDPYDED